MIPKNHPKAAEQGGFWSVEGLRFAVNAVGSIALFGVVIVASVASLSEVFYDSDDLGSSMLDEGL